MPLCKYCKSKEHLIDTCPEILCKLCNKKGHPHWKCELSNKSQPRQNKEIKSVISKNNNIIEICIKEEDIIIPEIINITKLNISNIKSIKDIPSVPWGDLIEI
tara:strand:+ start:1261 stop:1569 length:309 start_codon:yes stop_codon:yes gene_type:complete